MREKLKEASGEPITKTECRHHWIIESAKGPTSRGVCKFCGVEEEFSNLLPEFALMGRDTRVFVFPDSPDIEPDEEWDDAELEKSSANL